MLTVFFFTRIVGTTCVAIPMVLNGAIGAKLHVPFSVITTGSFGYYFRYFCIVSRAILAMFWFGIQGANGMVFQYSFGFVSPLSLHTRVYGNMLTLFPTD